MNENMNNERLVKLARFLRVGAIRGALQQGFIDREAALDMLAGCLEPDDESTRVDDRDLLDKSSSEVMEIIGLQPKDLSHLEDKNA